MPTGTGRGDGDPGSHSRHFGYLESYDIPLNLGKPLVKAYRRTGPAGHRLTPGAPADFELRKYFLFEVPDHIENAVGGDLPDGMNDLPWIHIAHLTNKGNSRAEKNNNDNDLKSIETSKEHDVEILVNLLKQVRGEK